MNFMASHDKRAALCLLPLLNLTTLLIQPAFIFHPNLADDGAFLIVNVKSCRFCRAFLIP